MSLKQLIITVIIATLLCWASWLLVIFEVDPGSAGFYGLLIFYARQQDWMACGITYLAAMGSVLVSYVRARAEGVGYSAKVGLLSRVERYLILVPLLIFNVPFWAVLILAVLTNFTALQRIFHVRSQAEKDPDNIIKS